MVAFAHLDDVFQLFTRHVSAAEPHAQGRLVNDRRVGGRLVREEDALPLDAMGDAVLDLGWRQLGDGLPEDEAGVVDRLEQPRDVGDLSRTDRRRVVLQLGQVEQARGQRLAVLVPPASSPPRGHRHECFDVRLLRTAVAVREHTDSIGADAETPGFDGADARRVDAQQLTRFAGGHPRPLT